MNLEKDLEKVKELLKDVKYLTFEQISSFLDWTEQNKKDYKAILMSWVDSGDLILSKKNRFSLPENLGYVKGVFRIIKNRFATQTYCKKNCTNVNKILEISCITIPQLIFIFGI